MSMVSLNGDAAEAWSRAGETQVTNGERSWKVKVIIDVRRVSESRAGRNALKLLTRAGMSDDHAARKAEVTRRLAPVNRMMWNGEMSRVTPVSTPKTVCQTASPPRPNVEMPMPTRAMPYPGGTEVGVQRPL